MSPIALNGRFTGTKQPTGTQTAAYGLFDAIIREPGRQRPLVVFADSRFLAAKEWAAVPNTTFIEVPFMDWSRGGAQLWEQFTFSRVARKAGCVIGHYPITTCPSWQNGLQTVVTLHDLNFYRHPEWYSRSFRLAFSLCAVPGIRRAARVVTISDYVLKQILEVLHLPPERLSLIYNGVKPIPFVEQPDSDGTYYVLAVGSLQPHKNLPRLIRAHQLLRKKYPELELRVVGRPQPRFADQPELIELLNSPGVKLLGYLSEEDLAKAYRNARVFCFPSLEEGFGLPLLEAMQAGTLVVTSNTSCLPEIAGPASICIDPNHDETIAAGLEQALTFSPEERGRRLREGREWSQKFSWQNAAKEYLKLYEEMLRK